MRRIAASIGLALLLSVALVLPVSAGERRPVPGHFSGSGAEVAQRCPGALTIGFDINGVLSHLGRMTGGGTNCTEFTLGTEIRAHLGRHRHRDRRRRLDAYPCLRGTARGADQRRRNIHRTQDTVIEGTGRFAGATGQLTIEGLIDFSRFPDLTVTGAVSGWISY